MKKKMKRLFAFLLASMMMFSTLSMTAAAEGEEYLMFLAYGGDAVESNDWGLQYYGDGAASNMGDIVATNAMAKVGDTVTIGLTMPAPAVYTWFMAPVIVAEGVTNVDYTIDSVKVDGNEILDTIDLSLGENAWWYEGTGDYTAEQAIRIKGGYNEWADKFIAESPANFTTIEYTITLNEVATGAAAGATEGGATPTDMPMFLAFGGDAAESNDWGLQYYGDGAASNMGDVVATNAVANVGDTVTIGLTFASPALYTWFTAPVLVAEGVTNVDYTIDSVTIDGVEMLDSLDLTIGENEWWYEGTGDYTGEQAIRLKGGYNEWAAQAMSASPANFSEIMYTITINDVTVGGGAAGGATPSTESYQAFIAIGADKEASNDWAYNYAGEDAAGITAVTGELKNGETTTLSLTFDAPVFYTWYVAPCFVVEDAALISEDSTFDVKVYLDGVEVTPDMSAGKACWAEGTGNFAQCIRIAGGYNEWGDKYLAESPAGFTEIKYEITPNILVSQPVEEPQFAFDSTGATEYHAYIGVQTPTWIFRNAWDDATYGKDSGCFDQMGFIDGEWLPQGGSFKDVTITGNGTYTVAVEGYDFSGTFEDQPILGADGLFNLLFVSTDLPVNDAVVISNVVLKMDGTKIASYADAFMDPDSKEVQKVLLANIWNTEIEALPYYAAPKQSIEISFDVTGFDNDAIVIEPAPEPSVDKEDPTEIEPAPEPSVDKDEPVADTPADTTTDAPAEEKGGISGGIIAAIVGVAVVAVGGGVVVAKKKKKSE